MAKKGRIVATGVNPQGVPWKEISFIGADQENESNDSEDIQKTKKEKK